MEDIGVELLETLMPIAMRSSNGALNLIGTFVFVFSCSCSFRILDHVFTT